MRYFDSDQELLNEMCEAANPMSECHGVDITEEGECVACHKKALGEVEIKGVFYYQEEDGNWFGDYVESVGN